MTTFRRAALLAAAITACAHTPRRERHEPTAAQLGCYQIHVEKGSGDRDLPAWFRQYIPDQVALSSEPENAEDTFDPGWRLSALRSEAGNTLRAFKSGAWWPLQNGGVEVHFGDGFSGVHTKLDVVPTGYEGPAHTYQDVGDVSYGARVRFERVACMGAQTIIDRRHGHSHQ